MWEDIPPVFRQGVDAVEVRDETVPHPEIGGIYTLGECLSEHWPSAYSEQGGDVRSRVVLYYGSFLALSGVDPAFGWREEIWETLLHELLHHREFAAAEYGLEEYDAAVEENFRRHAGWDFDPDFYRWVPADADGTVRIESEIFVESVVSPGRRDAEFGWRDRQWTVRVPGASEVLFVNPQNLAAGRLWVVVRRRGPWWSRLLGGPSSTDTRHMVRRALPVLLDPEEAGADASGKAHAHAEADAGEEAGEGPATPEQTP
jgi:hypothetical protein